MENEKYSLKCPECGSYFSDMLIEQFISGKTIICESCGFDYNPPPNAKDVISTATSNSYEEDEENEFQEPEEFEEYEEEFKEYKGYEENKEPKEKNNLDSKESNENFQQNLDDQQNFMVNGQYSRINEKMILKSLTGNWKTMRELARELNVQDAREFYVLRMILNEMHRKNIITMDFQIDRVLIRRKR